jgi:hypothetical protein
MTSKNIQSKILSFPAPLQKMLYVRLTVSIFSLLLFMLLLAFSTDIKLLLPPGLLFVYILLDGFILYGLFSHGDYMCLTGECVGIEKSFLRKRPQRIIMRVDGSTIMIHLSKERISAEAGDTISLYLSPTTPIRQEDGAYLINRYYAVRGVPGLQPGREKA